MGGVHQNHLSFQGVGKVPFSAPELAASCLRTNRNLPITAFDKARALFDPGEFAFGDTAEISRANLDELRRDAQALPLRKQIDFVHYCKTLAANADRHGDEGLYHFDHIIQFLAEFKVCSLSPLLRLTIDVATSDIASLRFTKDGPRITGLTPNSASPHMKTDRVHELFSPEEMKESRRLLKLLSIPDRSIEAAYALRIAPDAVGVFSKSGTLEALLPPPPPDSTAAPSFQTLYRLEVQSSWNYGSPLPAAKIFNVMRRFYTDLIAPICAANGQQSTKEHADYLSKLVPCLSAKEWMRVIDAVSKHTELVNELRGKRRDVRESVFKKSLPIMQKFVDEFLSHGLALIEALPAELHGDFQDLLKQVQSSHASIGQRFVAAVQINSMIFSPTSRYLEHLPSSTATLKFVCGEALLQCESDLCDLELERYFLTTAIGRASPSRSIRSLINERPQLREELSRALGQVEINLMLTRRSPTHMVRIGEVYANHNLMVFVNDENQGLGQFLAHLHHPKIRSELQIRLTGEAKELLKNLPIRTQIHLLRAMCPEEFAGAMSPSDFATLCECLQSKREIAEHLLSAFLSFAEGKNLSNEILSLAKHLDTKQAGAVFSKYREITDALDHFEQDLYKRFEGISVDREQINEIRRNLLSRANRILKVAADRIGTGEATPSTVEAMLAQLARAHRSVYEVSEAIKVLGVPLETLRAVEFSEESAVELDPDCQAELGQISKENCKRVYGESKYAQPHREFLASLDDPDTVIHTLRIEGKVVAFMRSTPTSEEAEIYIGSRNTDSMYEGYRFGFAIFAHVVAKLGRELRLTAFVKEGYRHVLEECERLGFSVCGRELDPEGKPTEFLKLVGGAQI